MGVVKVDLCCKTLMGVICIMHDNAEAKLNCQRISVHWASFKLTGIISALMTYPDSPFFERLAMPRHFNTKQIVCNPQVSTTLKLNFDTRIFCNNYAITQEREHREDIYHTAVTPHSYHAAILTYPACILVTVFCKLVGTAELHCSVVWDISLT